LAGCQIVDALLRADRGPTRVDSSLLTAEAFACQMVHEEDFVYPIPEEDEPDWPGYSPKSISTSAESGL
jgi:hypothetical protein